MSYDSLNLHSLRAREARLGKTIGKNGAGFLSVSVALLVIMGVIEIWLGEKWGYLLLTPALLGFMVAIWWRWQLSVVAPTGRGLNQQLSHEVLERLPVNNELSPVQLWEKLSKHWQSVFIINHLWFDPKSITASLSQESNDLMFVWDKSRELADRDNNPSIEVGHVAMALILTAHNLQPLLAQAKLTDKDMLSVIDWLDRILHAQRRKRQNYGGIGRDWAAGFTPNLNQFGHNVSASIEHYGGDANSLVDSPGVNSIKQAFSQGATAIALVGDSGIGKTSHVFALAQNILAESKDLTLAHNQIYSLDPAPIIPRKPPVPNSSC